VQTYGDSFCPMDKGPSALSFRNPRLEYSKDGNNHRTFGPGYVRRISFRRVARLSGQRSGAGIRLIRSHYTHRRQLRRADCWSK
jgi:hypothetical protein